MLETCAGGRRSWWSWGKYMAKGWTSLPRSLPSRGKRSLDSCRPGTEMTLRPLQATPSPCTLLNNLLLLGVTYHFPAPIISTPSCGGGPIGPAPQGASFPRRKGALALFRCLSPLPPLPSTSVLAYVMFFPYKFHLAALCSQTIR